MTVRLPIDRQQRRDFPELPLSLFLAPLRRHRVLLGVATAVGFAIGAGVGLLRTRTYTASTTFMLQAHRPSAASGIAAQFGITLGSGDADQSPQFYVDLVQSRTVLEPVAESVYTFHQNGVVRHEPLAEVLHVKAETAGERRDDAVKALGRVIAASVEAKTGVITVATTLPSADLAAMVTRAIVDQVTRFNLVTRQSQAAAERRFTQQRLAQAKGELLAAQNALQAFLDQNRDYERAPRLVFDYQRLSRVVSTDEQVVASLTQSFEQARIDEVRDTPVITVIEPVEVPARPNPRGALKLALGLAVAGFLVAALWVIGRARPWREV